MLCKEDGEWWARLIMGLKCSLTKILLKKELTLNLQVAQVAKKNKGHNKRHRLTKNQTIKKKKQLGKEDWYMNADYV